MIPDWENAPGTLITMRGANLAPLVYASRMRSLAGTSDMLLDPRELG